MGIFARFLGLPDLDAVTTASTWDLGSGSDVAQVRAAGYGAAAAFGLNLDTERVERREAMRIPAVRRGRQVICGSIGACALVGHRVEPTGLVTDVTSARALLTQPDPDTTRAYLLTWTVDDLLFYGVAWWLVTDRDPEGFPRHVERLTRDRIALPGVGDRDRRVSVDGRRVADADVLRFDGPDEGVLEYGGPTLSTSQLIEAAVRRFARLDVPLGSLQLRDGAEELDNRPGSCGIEDDPRSEVDMLLDSWEAARSLRTTAYLNGALDYQVHAFDATELQLVEGRTYQAAELARLMNLAPRYVNAPSASGMTYTNVEAERRDLVDTTLLGYIVALEQRLSMPDVTPRGTTVRVDLTTLLRGDTLTALQAAEVAVRLEALTSEEVRVDILGRSPLPPGTIIAPPRPAAPAPAAPSA